MQQELSQYFKLVYKIKLYWHCKYIFIDYYTGEWTVLRYSIDKKKKKTM